MCVSWGSTEPAMPNQHSTTSMGSPQQQGASRNAVLKELCALNPFHVNNAAPGKSQPQCSCFHQAAETSRTATKPGRSGVYSGGFFGEQAGGETHREFLWCNIFVLLFLQHIGVEFMREVSSKCKFRTPRAVLLCWEQGSTRALEHISSKGLHSLL